VPAFVRPSLQGGRVRRAKVHTVVGHFAPIVTARIRPGYAEDTPRIQVGYTRWRAARASATPRLRRERGRGRGWRRKVGRERVGHQPGMLRQREIPRLIELRARKAPAQAVRADPLHADRAGGGGDAAGFEQGDEEGALFGGSPAGPVGRGRGGAGLFHRKVWSRGNPILEGVLGQLSFSLQTEGGSDVLSGCVGKFRRTGDDQNQPFIRFSRKLRADTHENVRMPPQA
jgi:hypothetical protein